MNRRWDHSRKGRGREKKKKRIERKIIFQMNRFRAVAVTVAVATVYWIKFCSLLSFGFLWMKLTLISELGWSMNTISDSSPSNRTLTVFSPNSSSIKLKTCTITKSLFRITFYSSHSSLAPLSTSFSTYFFFLKIFPFPSSSPHPLKLWVFISHFKIERKTTKNQRKKLHFFCHSPSTSVWM